MTSDQANLLCTHSDLAMTYPSVQPGAITGSTTKSMSNYEATTSK